MPSRSRAQHLCTLCQELRAIVADSPRSDSAAKAQSLAIIQQLRSDPYASLHTHERLSKVTAALERWFAEAPTVKARDAHELREAMMMELAHIETEQRLRSWLMDIVS